MFDSHILREISQLRVAMYGRGQLSVLNCETVWAAGGEFQRCRQSTFGLLLQYFNYRV